MNGEAADLRRPLGTFEWSMWLTERVVPTNCLMMAEVSGELDEARLRQALAWTQAKHPPLRVRIALLGERPAYQPTDAPVPLRVLEGDWRPEAERELRTPMDAPEGPLVRCSLIRHGPSRSTVLLSFSHVVVDGFSMVTVMEQLLRATSLLALGETLAPVRLGSEAPLEARLPGWCRSPAVLARVAAFVAREQATNLRWGAPRPLVDQPPAVDARRAVLVAHHFDEELTARLAAQSRRHGVPVQSTLAAAQLLGVADELGREPVPLWLGCSVNLRQRLEPPVTSPDQLGLYVSLLGLSARVDPRQSVWRLANQLRREEAQRIDRQEPFLTFPLASRTFSLLRRWFTRDAAGARRFVDLMRGMFPAGTTLSNLGRVAIALPESGPLRLERLHFASGDSVVPLTAAALTCRGRLQWNFLNYVSGAGARVVERIVDRLREAVAA